MSATYGWIITQDADADASAPPASNCNAVGVIGPRNIDPANELLLRGAASSAFKAVDLGGIARFRMFDDDDNLCYQGLFIGDSTSERAFGPLDDFGRPNVGATRIDYLRNGTWETL